MAYTKFDFIKNLDQGNGLITQYGTTPRTFDGDLALISNCTDYSTMRRIDAQLQDPNDAAVYHDITVWAGVTTGNEGIASANLDSTKVVPFVAIPCPPYSVELQFFDEDEVLELLMDWIQQNS